MQKRFEFDNVFRFQFKVSAIKLRNTVKVHYTKDVLEKSGCLTVILGISGPLYKCTLVQNLDTCEM